MISIHNKDIYVSKEFGKPLCVSTILNGYRYARTYIGYTRRKAIREFKYYIRNVLDNDSYKYK